MPEKKIARANYYAEYYYGLDWGREYILEKQDYGMWSIYDFNGHYITDARTDCFDNYRNLEN